MNTISKKNPQQTGFSIIELLVVLAIIGVMLAVVLASVKASKEKASDAQVVKSISEIALKAEQQEIAPGVINYSSAFNTIGAQAAIAELATTVKAETNYQIAIASDGLSYAISFPLKKGGYYCIDSENKASGRVVAGLFNVSGPKNCGNATRVAVSGAGTPPIITFVSLKQDPTALCGNGGGYGTNEFLSSDAPTPMDVGQDDCVVPLESSSNAIQDTGTYQLSDPDENLTSSNVIRTFGANIEFAPGNGQYFIDFNSKPNPNLYFVYETPLNSKVCKNYYTPVTYTVTDSEGNSASATRNLIYCDYDPNGYE